jgi:hypothetical protein
MNTKKLKIGDRIIWIPGVEEIVIDKNDDEFTTIDSAMEIQAYNNNGKITNARKLKPEEYTVHLDDLISDLQTDFLEKCKRFAKTLKTLEDIYDE